MSLKRINLQSLVANAMGKLEVSLKVGIMGTKEKRNVDKVEYYKVESCVLIAPIVQVKRRISAGQAHLAPRLRAKSRVAKLRIENVLGVLHEPSDRSYPSLAGGQDSWNGKRRTGEERDGGRETKGEGEGAPRAGRARASVRNVVPLLVTVTSARCTVPPVPCIMRLRLHISAARVVAR